MALPRGITKFNKAFGNKVMIHLAGHGPFVELEHVGRRSGTTYRIPLNAFRQQGGDRDTVTCALTYGPDVDWVRNVRAAGGCRMRMGGQILTLGAPANLPTDVGLSRMPAPARVILRLAHVTEFIEMPVVGSRPARRVSACGGWLSS